MTDSAGKDTVDYNVIPETCYNKIEHGLVWGFVVVAVVGKRSDRLKVTLEDASVKKRMCGDRWWRQQLGTHPSEPRKGHGRLDQDGWSWCCKKRGRHSAEVIRCKNQQALVTNTS